VDAPPRLVVFDVNETLSDMSPIAECFERLGLDPREAESWFAGVLRDGFALTSVGVNPAFAKLASESLRTRLSGHESIALDIDEAVTQVMSTFTALPVHPDVVPGIRALQRGGVRLVTLSNGSASVAEGLLERAGVGDAFERLMSVESARAWKPHPASYAYALEQCHIPAGEAMLVAVHPWDLDGAARAGLRTGWLNRAGAAYPSYFRSPEVEATDLVALADRWS
jgi:2-haloacid dehalogenase